MTFGLRPPGPLPWGLQTSLQPQGVPCTSEWAAVPGRGRGVLGREKRVLGRAKASQDGATISDDAKLTVARCAAAKAAALTLLGAFTGSIRSARGRYASSPSCRILREMGQPRGRYSQRPVAHARRADATPRRTICGA